MKYHFPSIQAADSNWNDWSWQMRHSLKTRQDFESYFELSEEEKAGFASGESLFNIRATPYYAELAKLSPAIRKIIMPTDAELSSGRQALLDPLAEVKNSPAPRIIHRYPDRVLFLITDICTVYCRYCTRKHFTGKEQAFIKKDEYRLALDYIKSKSGIREVILSGGDPLSVSNSQLEQVLKDLRSIEHIEIIRIGSRVPVVCPMRIDESLAKMIRKYSPVFLMTHFNHPAELTEESKTALELFVDHGIPVFNQMVLLKGINNHAAIVQALCRRLLYLRVKPYYLFQCDPSEGTDHLRTSIEESKQIQKELWGNLSGLAMPNLSLDIPEGGGKVSLVPDFETDSGNWGAEYRGWDQVTAKYLNPNPASSISSELPADYEKYLPEWEALKAAKK